MLLQHFNVSFMLRFCFDTWTNAQVHYYWKWRSWIYVPRSPMGTLWEGCLCTHFYGSMHQAFWVA